MSFVQSRLRGQLIEVFKYLNGSTTASALCTLLPRLQMSCEEGHAVIYKNPQKSVHAPGEPTLRQVAPSNTKIVDVNTLIFIS